MTWTNPPTRFKKTVRADTDKTARNLALRVLRGVIFTSPVDTGRFRGNWLVNFKRPATGAVSKKDQGGSSTFSEGSAKLKRAGKNAVIYISNNLPYAQRLNDGWSKQAPANFVQRAIKRALRK